MIILMIFLLMIYTIVVVAMNRLIFMAYVQKQERALSQLEDTYTKLLNEKDKLQEEHATLDKQFTQIFTLYDLTKAMTRNFSQEETIQAFKNQLWQSSRFTDCLLIAPADSRTRKEKEQQGYFLVELMGQKRQLGVLAILGLETEKRDTIFILTNQLSMALRRIRLYQDIERLAITDSLTEVYTRRYVLERFEEELLRAENRKSSIAFLLIDIDFFKSYNDQYGHLTGDLLLHEIAGIIKSQIRGIDIIGRYGGEEFCVVLPDADNPRAVYVAERIRSTVFQSSIKAYDTITKASVSIGIAVYPHDAAQINELIDKADFALYRAKRSGRNRVLDFRKITNSVNEKTE